MVKSLDWPLCGKAGFYDRETQTHGPLNFNIPDCDGQTESGPGGGIVCTKCHAWFCF